MRKKDLYKLEMGDYILRVNCALITDEQLKKMFQLFDFLNRAKNISIHIVFAPDNAIEFIPTVKKKGII